MMYKCSHCGFAFSIPSERREDVGGHETGIGYMRADEYIATCPDCGSDNIENAVRCSICGEYEYEDSAYLSDDLEYLCEKCKGVYVHD